MSGRKLPPLEQTLLALAQLKKSRLVEKGQFKEYCAKVHGIILLFVRDYFGIKDKEMVFDELREEIVNIDRMGYEEKKYVLDIFRSCEDIKYAPEEPEELQGLLDIDNVISFIKSVSISSQIKET